MATFELAVAEDSKALLFPTVKLQLNTDPSSVIHHYPVRVCEMMGLDFRGSWCHPVFRLRRGFLHKAHQGSNIAVDIGER